MDRNNDDDDYDDNASHIGGDPVSTIAVADLSPRRCSLRGWWTIKRERVEEAKNPGPLGHLGHEGEPDEDGEVHRESHDDP